MGMKLVVVNWGAGEGEEDSDFREWEEAINLEDAMNQSFNVCVCLSPRVSVWVSGFGIRERRSLSVQTAV